MSGPAYKLSEELLTELVKYQYTLERPFPEENMEEHAQYRYRSDALFHNRVNSMHAGLMTLIGKHVDWAVLEEDMERQLREAGRFDGVNL